MTSPKQFDEFDVVILGSGGAGLVAALAAAESGARVGLFEKAEQVGGTTAISGGSVWLPDNQHVADVGPPDDPDQAEAYLASLSLGMIDPQFAHEFATEGRELGRWLEQVSPLRFEAVGGFPDYHPEHPGGRAGGGRTLDPLLYSFRELGEWADRIASTRSKPRARLKETPLGGGTGFLSPEVRAERAETDLRGCGAALVGSLLRAVLDRGVTVSVNCRAVELLRSGNAVTGARLDTPDGACVVAATRAVILATGGFEWDAEATLRFLRGPMTSPASVPTNTGDGLRMLEKAGASLANMSEAWWAPTIEVPGDTAFGMPRALLLLRERTFPRSIMVNRDGVRFANEATNYNALAGAFHALDPMQLRYANLPCWLVFDEGFVQQYGFLAPPRAPVAEWVTRAVTVATLAELIGVPASALEASVARWNAHVRDGRDPDFHRGESAYDRWSGDTAARGTPASTLGPLDRAPYYAVPVHSGCLGTKGGARTDLHGRVLDPDGVPIEGLYAVGNVAASPTGRAYPGGGGTLGPILFLSRRAGVHAAQGTA